MRWMWLAALAAACAWAERTEPAWTLVRSDHFEIYSQSDTQTARAALQWFEQLRMFFQQGGFRLDGHTPVRVIEFRSAKEYDTYRPRPGADAYYVGTGARDYIVMRSLGPAEFSTSAHEYAHFVLHANGLKLPLWLEEGVAEFFSSIRITQHDCFAGEERPARVSTLKHEPWLPMQELLAAMPGDPMQTSRRTAPVFYAQSWALAQMLMLSPEYRAHFPEVIARVIAGALSSQALTSAYRKSLNEITRDLHRWIENRRFTLVRLPGVENARVAIESQTLSGAESSLLLADLAMANGKLDRARGLYDQSARRSPKNADIWAALGAIALRKGDTELARLNWKRAIESGVEDAQLCFRYAALADDAGLGADEIRPALQRAIALAPEFDDARYKLALLESNTGHFEETLAQLCAMRKVAAGRAFGYWITMAYASEELGQRQEAKDAAGKALEHAANDQEREQAQRLAYMAATDFGVRVARDADGRLQLVTTRVPHETADWNPFVEPGDQMRRVEGELQTVNCASGKATGVVIETTKGRLQLAIADATQVQMRNAPAEFICGSQIGNPVVVDYAASANAGQANDGLLRGMEFRQ
jgi:tetratricopeptide (TPR) repeat protein